RCQSTAYFDTADTPKERMDIKEQTFLQNKTTEELAEMVIQIGLVFCVQSLAKNGALYNVGVKDGLILKCDRLHNSFTRRLSEPLHRPCKHMFLLERASEGKDGQLQFCRAQAIQAAVEVSEHTIEPEIKSGGS
ncbi:hypothetical protein BGX21_006121, partial [Mortierella sp. AD011]